MDRFQKQDASLFGLILDTNRGERASAEAQQLGAREAEEWHMAEEGQLAVDVVETEKDIIVVSTIAGVALDKIEVYLRSDLLTIRGFRKDPIDQETVRQLFYRECFWGPFSRTIVLPLDVKADCARAEYANGIVTIRIPKREEHERAIPITVVEE